MTSAFIIQVQPQLQSDPNEETAALLRVLIHKIDNTTFGNDIPTIPQWSGPPHTIVQVQAILYTSLATSLFSAFLAMLGKQWLNKYASIDMRGSAIERSQNRQRKLDGIVTWYFDHVMESLPLMLQFALLLLGCALSRYLWEIDTTVASVVLGVTSFGVASYAFFVVAGAASVSCPYQTPGARILRHIPPLALGAFRSASSHSEVIYAVVIWWRLGMKNFKCSMKHVVKVTLLFPIALLVGLVIDAYRIVRATARGLVANTLGVCGWLHRAGGWDPQTAALDLHCISWMLQTSLDKTIHLLALRLLATMTTLASFDPALISACLDILAGCVSVVSGKLVILPGSEELAALSALCCLRTLAHLTTVDPVSNVFKDMRRRYTKVFPIETDFGGFPSHHHFCIIHNTFYPSHKLVGHRMSWRDGRRPKIQWRDYKPSGTEHVVLVQLARFRYQGKEPRKVPRWILRFAHHLLSQDPLPPASAISDCLSIIAMDLGCATSSATTLDERYVHIRQIFTLLTKNQCTAGGGFEPDDWGTQKHG